MGKDYHSPWRHGTARHEAVTTGAQPKGGNPGEVEVKRISYSLFFVGRSTF